MSARGSNDWRALQAAGIVRRIGGGTTLFRAGDEADGAYIVLSGGCAVIEGDEQVGVLEVGDLFGEIGALGSGVRSATVLVIEDSELLFLSPRQLQEGLGASPELFWQSLRLVVSRLRQVAARQSAYRDEHKALRDVQRSLLPDLSRVDLGGAFGVEAVWEPCTYASGDYFDVVPVDTYRHLIVVGDVMGHGAESSLMMAIARAQVHELARSFRRTDEVLLNLDGYLRDNAPPKQGMSMVVACYDRRDRVLEYSAAGHPFPLLRRGGEVSDLEGRPGIILGLPFLVGAGYERRQTELEPGDSLLFFTDGLFEVPVDDAGTQLGRAGLALLFDRAMAVGDGTPLTRLLASVAELDVNDAADDDRTALLMTVV